MKSKPRTLNAMWYAKYPMPKNPTLLQRIEWHLDHYKNCGCRPIPDKLKEEMKKLKIEIPS